MGPKKDPTMLVEELITALSDKRVLDALGNVMEAKLQSIIQSVTILENENKHMANDIKVLQNDLKLANAKIESLENYNRLDNLIFTGLPVVNYSEAASVNSNNHDAESSLSTEQAVLELVNNTMKVSLTAGDISVAHRLRKKPSDSTPARVIVRFTNRKARNAVFAARRQLKSYSGVNGHKIYVNEDLTHETADLFRQARQLVKQKSIFGCWTSGGVIYVKKSEHDSKPTKISLLSDLHSL